MTRRLNLSARNGLNLIVPAKVAASMPPGGAAGTLPVPAGKLEMEQ